MFTKCELKVVAMISFKLLTINSKAPLVALCAIISYSYKKEKKCCSLDHEMVQEACHCKMQPVSEILSDKKLCRLESMKYSIHVMIDCYGMTFSW